MDDICVILPRCAAWLENSATPRVFFAGSTARLQFTNPPTPHLEITFMEKGGVEDLRIGEESFALPEGWVSLHGIHFGNYSPPKREPGRSWCAMIDATDAPPELDFFRQRPVFSSLRAGNPVDLAEAFMSLRRLCARPGRIRQGYVPTFAMFDPGRPDCSPALRLRVKAALLDLLGVIMENLPAPDRSPALPPGLQTALRLIESRYAEPELNLPELAAAAFLSPDHFGRLFKKYLGVSPLTYAQTLRLREAAALLRNTSDRIGQIAQAVGYVDPLFFSRLFRRQFRLSPRQFRQKFQRQA